MLSFQLNKSVLLLGLALAIVGIVSPATGDPVLSLGKTTVSGSPTDSGFVDVFLSPSFSGSVGYVNIVSDLDGNGDTSNDWLVQNVPIPMKTGEFGEYSANFSMPFSLGSLAPTGNYDVYASFTAAPVTAPSLGSMQLNSAIPFATNDIAGHTGVEPGVIAGGGGNDSLPLWSSPTSGTVYGNGGPVTVGVVRYDVPSIKQTGNECAPTSVLQSAFWLRDRKGLKGLPSQADLLSKLKDAMNVGWDKDNPYPGVNSVAEMKAGKEAVFNTDLKLGLIIKDGVSWDFLKNEINHDEDVEIVVTAANGDRHAVTVAGWYDDGTKRKIYIVDPATGKPATAYDVTGTTINGFWMGNVTIEAVLSESIPEPGSLGALATGLAALAAVVGRRRKTV
jgi:hypothetical protein